MNRTLNIIKRAVNEFGMNVDINDSLQDIFDRAQDIIEENVDYDYISECERNRHYDHITWSDGKGFDLEADGEFISSDASRNRYYRLKNGEYHPVAWYDQNEDDFVLMSFVIDTDGRKVALVCK